MLFRSVLQNDAVIIVARGMGQGEEASNRLAQSVLAYGLHVGTRLPAHATSTGQVLLANLKPVQLNAWLKTYPLSRLTPHTATQVQAFKKKLKVVAQQDHCWAVQEHELAVEALAVPLRDVRGEVIAALNVVRTGAESGSADWVARCLPLLHKTAQDLRPLI